MQKKTYKIIPTKTFLKDLKKIDNKVAESVLKKLDDLKTNPYIGLKLTNISIAQWRVRVGNYRIRYDIEDDQIILKMIRHRNNIYQ